MKETFTATTRLGMHIPYTCSSLSVVTQIINGKKICIIDNPNNECRGVYHINGCDIYVYTEYVTEEWLRTPIKGKHLYIPIYGGCSWMPVMDPGSWIISSTPAEHHHVDYSFTDIHTSRGYVYGEIKYTDETCIAELLCNAHAYYFDVHACAFVRHSNPEWNLIKPSVRRFLPTITGGNEDRIADYGRLILFLLSRVDLTEEERAIISPLLEFVPSIDELTPLVRKETLVQRFVSEAKRYPKRFLEWKERWSKFWWEDHE